MTIKQLMEESYNTAVEKGWWRDGVSARNFGEIMMLWCSEIAEAFEEYRKSGLEEKKMIYYGDNGKPEGIAVEIADLLIRVGDTCKAYDIPIEEALKIKMEYNKNRPYRHGGKLA